MEKRTGVDHIIGHVNPNSHCVIYVGKEAHLILEDLRGRKEDIPPGVKMVVKVRKIFDHKNFKGSFDFEESLSNSERLGSSFVLMEGDVVLGIHVAQGIAEAAATKLRDSAVSLCEAGGYVERAKDKHSEPMAMFGYRIAKTFDRYTHPPAKRLRGKSSRIRDIATGPELERFGEDYAEEFQKHLKQLFPRRMKALSDLYEKSMSFGRMGKTPFSGLGITKDFF